MKVTVDEVLRAATDLERERDYGFLVADIANRIGVSTNLISPKLNKLVKIGRLVKVGRRDAFGRMKRLEGTLGGWVYGTTYESAREGWTCSSRRWSTRRG
ncbi:TPA: hypothetical protein EYP44_04920 [Candidatus Bathyarchaeota archaeon]|nr:hypothetical protein [Candidatus Bathyarchaeota archaeon]